MSAPTPDAPASTMESWEEPDSGPCKLRLNIPESTLLLPCTDTEEASQRMLRRVAMTSCLLPETLGRNLALPESELQGVLYASRGDIGEDRYTVLLKWIQTNGQGATNGRLLEALCVGGDVKCAQEVCMEIFPESVSRDVAVPLHRRRSDMVLDLISNSVPSSRTSTPYNPALHSLHTTPIKANPVVPAFIGIGGEVKQVPATSPAYHQGVINPTAMQTNGAVPQSMVGRPGPTDRVATLAFPSKNGVALSPHAKGGDTDSPGRRGTDLSVVGSCPVAGEQCEVNDAGLCPTTFGRQIHNSLLKMLNEGALARADVEAINKGLAAKLEYQEAATENRVRQLMRAWSDTTALRKSNAALKTELDVSKEMLRLTWSYLQQFRSRVHDEVAPLETQLSQLELCDDSGCTGCSYSEEEPLLSEEVEKLRRDRKELETQVESLTSMHQTALEEMSSYEVKETMRISERERLQKEVDYSTLQMRDLLTKVSTLDQNNQDWEERCGQLEQRTREQDAQIVLLNAEVARLKDQAATPLKPAYQRWHSLPLTGASGSPSSVHPPLHRDAEIGGFEGDSETNKDGPTLKKKAGSVHGKKICATLARPGVSKSGSQEECTAEEVLAEKYPLEMWFGNIHRVMSHYAMRSHKLRNDAQSLFKRMSSKCEDSSSTPTTPATTTSTPTTPTTTPVLTTQDSPTPTPVPTTPIPTAPASTTSAPSTSA